MPANSSSVLRRALRGLAWVAVIGGVLLVIGYFVLIQPGKGGVLARSTAPDGTECLVTQSWNGWDNGGEPYTVSFYSRKPGGPWLWQYLDHEARRWSDCRLEHDPAKHAVLVFSGGQLKETIDLNWPFQHEETPPYLPRGS